MNIDKIGMVQELLAFALLKDKSNLIDLLRRNGVDMPYDASDDDVLVATLNASVKSKYFKDELTKLLSNMALENVDTFTSFTGEEEFFNFTTFASQFVTAGQKAGKIPTGTTGTTGTGTGTKTKTGTFLNKVGGFLKTNVFTPENINAGISLGLTSMNNKSQRRADDAAANLEQIRMQKLALEAQTGGGAGAGNTGGGKNKTIMWVLVGVGVLALATGVFFIVKKNRSKTTAAV